MPRFSANLGFLWPGLPLLEQIDAAAQAGFRAIELHCPYATPAEAVRDACARHGLTLLGINTWPGDMSKGEMGLGALGGRERDFQAAIDQSIAWCRASGAVSIHAVAGVVAPQDRAVATAVLTANLKEAADKAQSVGLTLLLEALNPRDRPNYIYSTLGEVADVIAAVERPNVKMMFDAYHVGVAEGDILTKLDRHFPLVGHVQIAAVPSRAEPDEGEIAYPAIFAELDRLGYRGWIGCEYTPRATTEAGMGWVEALGVHL